MQGEPTKCPYRSICQCPGFDPDEGDWEPVDGFKRVPEGILCLDWNKVVPLTELPKEPEGRHITDAVIAADKIDTARRKYSKSSKRREAQKKHEERTNRKAFKKYTETEKFKLAIQKYRESEKGKEAYQRRRDLVKDFREAAKWLRENPGKTYDDWLKEQTHGG